MRVSKSIIDKFKNGELIVETSNYRYVINGRGQILRALKTDIQYPDAWTVVEDLSKEL